jgi:hypothetical protein
MEKTKTPAADNHQTHAVGVAALLIIQKTLEQLLKHGVITNEQLNEIYKSARQDHQERKHALHEPAVHQWVDHHIQRAAEVHWPPDDIQ